MVALRLVRHMSSAAGKSKDRFVLPIAEDALPHGYALTGLHSGVKKKKEVFDLAVLRSTTARTSAAGVFTTNAFRAAPVLVSEAVLRSTEGRANSLVVNSGCANAVTGERGLADAWAMARAGAGDGESLVMSTGVIGQHLPIDAVVAGVRAAPPTFGSDGPAWLRAARAFMTTDTFPKLRARAFELPGWGTVRVAGITKGAGMIHPEMAPHATLLAVLATDAPVAPKALTAALAHATDRSFNAISVDGDTSTNDSLVAFANGAAFPSAAEITENDSAAFTALRDTLADFAAELAQLVVRDGEGATKFVAVRVAGASSFADAQVVARTVATSALVKTALYGEDANWGRVLAAVGRARPLSAPVDPTRVSVSFVPTDGSPELALLVRGEPEAVDEVRAKQILEEEDLEVLIDLGAGTETATYWTCDFSHEYVTINGSYRS